MKISCKCLNVTIFSQDPSVKDVDIANLNLTPAEESDAFFKEALGAAEYGRISKVQSGLVQVRISGVWLIHSCLNCGMNTHAIHREKGAAVVLFNKELLVNPEEIAALRNSDQYSSVFRIVINNSESEAPSESLTKFAVSQLPAPTLTAVSALQQQLADSIQRETTCTEERVRRYSEQQYAALEEFRERAHRDHRSLIRLLCRSQEKFCPSETTQIILTETVHSPSDQGIVPSVLPSPASVTGPLNRSSQHEVDGTPLAAPRVSRARPVVPLAQGRRSKGAGSFDTEGLFDLEGMDNPEEVVQFEEESDSDESGSHDEGIHIPRDRGFHNLAKSLPVNVPSYMPAEKRAGVEEDDEALPHDPMDIAASIKALARSVHGDANVFGDLPKPRFSTQI